MKKFISLALIIGILLCSGCGAKQTQNNDVKENAPDISEEVVDPNKNPYVAMMESNNRPVAVMIDNDGESSRPQIGLEDAYMVYEIIIEGGSSRLMALFKDASKVEKVGPIRSSRHYFLDYALEHDAIYCHAGWSPKASSDISTLKVNNVNGIMGDDGVNFYRDNTYDSSWHNLYTKLNKLYDYAENKKKYNVETSKTHTAYNDEDTEIAAGTDVQEIKFSYSPKYSVTYKYNAEEKIYTRFIGTKEHMSQTGNALTAKNIIAYNIRNFDLNDGEKKGRQDLENLGSGNGWYITNGKAVEITWNKESRTGRTVYKTADGNELKLNPGNTYIQIIPNEYPVTIQ